MKKIFLTAAAAAFTLGFAACSSEDATTTTTADTSMTTAPMTTPADNTGMGIEGGDMNTTDTANINSGGTSGSSGNSGTMNNSGNRSSQGGSNSSGIMGPGTNVTNTGSGGSSSSSTTTKSNTGNNNDPERFQAGPDVKTPTAPNSQRGGNEVIEKANERNDRSDRVKTPKDVNPRTGLAPVR